ncbi:MAG: DUF1573 domain-containing protein, partial [Cyclobacteriaceae bacterium]|nr:DUF1573 domain-containing protein [Cyclobacteriaceae bacterium]
MKIHYLAACMLCLGTWASLAQPAITFRELSYDFREIKEEEGPVSHTFYFKNTGKEPFQLTNVATSCGCTTSQWSQDWIAPGDSGFVVARYEPLNRFGSFSKSLQLTFSNSVQSTLYIRGVVQTKSENPKSSLPIAQGAFRTYGRTFPMGQLSTEKPVSRWFEWQNDSDTTIRIVKQKIYLPAHLRVSFYPEVLKPGQRGELMVTFYPGNTKHVGFFSEQLLVPTTDKNQPEKIYAITGSIIPYHSTSSKKEPRLSFTTTEIDLGGLEAGSKETTFFDLINTGQSRLTIQSVQTNCDCLQPSLAKKELAPGDSVRLFLTMDGT